MLHYDESYSTLLFAIKAMSVRTKVVMNERVEVKRELNDDARSLGGMSGMNSRMASQNELVLQDRNSQLVVQTQRLEQEV